MYPLTLNLKCTVPDKILYPPSKWQNLILSKELPKKLFLYNVGMAYVRIFRAYYFGFPLLSCSKPHLFILAPFGLGHNDIPSTFFSLGIGTVHNDPDNFVFQKNCVFSSK